MQVGVGVLVDDRIGVEEVFVEGDADRQIADGKRHVGQGRKRCHGLLPFRGSAVTMSMARRVGYDSEEAFSRAFKRGHGLSPSHWRAARLPAT